MQQINNAILARLGHSKLYIPELKIHTKTVTASILMMRLEYWFDKNDYQGGFYKFLEPCQHELYKKGDSWIEELGFSTEAFTTAFKQIGIRYKSKKEFDNATDKFQGKFYYSITDKITHLTFYYRNDTLVNELLNKLFIKLKLNNNGD